MTIKSSKKLKSTDCYVESTTIGERGQVVIPKEIRDALRLKTGESLLVMLHNGAVVMMPKQKNALKMILLSKLQFPSIKNDLMPACNLSL